MWRRILFFSSSLHCRDIVYLMLCPRCPFFLGLAAATHRRVLKPAHPHLKGMSMKCINPCGLLIRYIYRTAYQITREKKPTMGPISRWPCIPPGNERWMCSESRCVCSALLSVITQIVHHHTKAVLHAKPLSSLFLFFFLCPGQSNLGVDLAPSCGQLVYDI